VRLLLLLFVPGGDVAVVVSSNGSGRGVRTWVPLLLLLVVIVSGNDSGKGGVRTWVPLPLPPLVPGGDVARCRCHRQRRWWWEMGTYLDCSLSFRPCLPQPRSEHVVINIISCARVVLMSLVVRILVVVVVVNVVVV
jgi:hypothetical protein